MTRTLRGCTRKHTEEEKRAILEYWRDHPNEGVADVARAIGTTYPYVYSVLQKYERMMPSEHTIAAHKARAKRKRKKRVPMATRVKMIERSFINGDQYDSTLIGYRLGVCLHTARLAMREFEKTRRAEVSARLHEKAKQRFRDGAYMRYANYCALMIYNPNIRSDEVCDVLGVTFYTFCTYRRKYGAPAFGIGEARYRKWRETVEELEITRGRAHVNRNALEEARRRGIKLVPLNLVGEEYQRYLEIYNLKRAGFTRDQIARRVLCKQG